MLKGGALNNILNKSLVFQKLLRRDHDKWEPGMPWLACLCSYSKL